MTLCITNIAVVQSSHHIHGLWTAILGGRRRAIVKLLLWTVFFFFCNQAKRPQPAQSQVQATHSWHDMACSRQMADRQWSPRGGKKKGTHLQMQKGAGQRCLYAAAREEARPFLARAWVMRRMTLAGQNCSGHQRQGRGRPGEHAKPWQTRDTSSFGETTMVSTARCIPRTKATH